MSAIIDPLKSLSQNRQEIFLFVGPRMCGKSSFIRSLLQARSDCYSGHNLDIDSQQVSRDASRPFLTIVEDVDCKQTTLLEIVKLMEQQQHDQKPFALWLSAQSMSKIPDSVVTDSNATFIWSKTPDGIQGPVIFSQRPHCH